MDKNSSIEWEHTDCAVRRPQSLFVAIAIGFAILFCPASWLAQAAEQPDALLRYPLATKVWSGQVQGADQLTYHVEVQFPAPEVIRWISDELKRQGWEALPHDFLNEDAPSSQLRGWYKFIDGRERPEVCVHQWLGDWKNPSGDIVRYVFRYRSAKCNDSKLRDLEVFAAYYPEPMVRRQREAIRKLLQRPGT